jgi:hypothetical protein
LGEDQIEAQSAASQRKKKIFLINSVRAHRRTILMKRAAPTDDTKEREDRERKKVRSNDESLFVIIPIEVIYLIVSFCGIVERHALRFVSKDFHRLAHKCAAIEDNDDNDKNGGSFWFRRLDNLSIFVSAAEEGHLSILQWMRTYLLMDRFFLDEQIMCERAASGGHLKVLNAQARSASRNGLENMDVFGMTKHVQMQH